MAIWYNSTEGTWIIKGEFDNSMILDDSGIYVHALGGNGTIVITYNSSGAKVFTSGVLSYETTAPPDTVNGNGIVLCNGGICTIENTLFIPREFSESEAKSAAVGNADVFEGIPRIFNSNQIGWAYDHNDDSTLFTDSAGTTPAQLEDPIGLQLDKSRGLKLGPELVTNGTFDIDSDWALDPESEISGGVLSTTKSGTGEIASQSVSITAGLYYQITYTVLSTNGEIIVPRLSGSSPSSAPATTTTGTFTAIVLAVSNTDRFAFNAASGGVTATIDNVSVRELPGNHRFQDVSADRPILSARYNLLTKTEQFADGVWNTIGSTVISNTTTAPNGTLTADKLIEEGGTSVHRLDRAIFPADAGPTVGRVLGKDAGDNRFLILRSSGDGTNQWAVFDLVNGLVTETGTEATGSILEDEEGFFLCKLEYTSSASTDLLIILSNSATPGTALPSYTGDGTSGIYLWGASLLPAHEASLPYQRVNTATDYDGDKSKFPRYLKGNGTNTRMETASFAPGSDKVAAFMGLRKLSDAATGIAFTFGAAGADGSFTLYTPDGAAANAAFQSRGTLTSKATATGLTAPLSFVATAIGDIAGDSASLSIDGGTAVVSASDQGTGNYATLAAEFFANTDGTLFADMREYSSVLRFGPITADETNAIEQYIASRVPGVTI